MTRGVARRALLLVAASIALGLALGLVFGDLRTPVANWLGLLGLLTLALPTLRLNEEGRNLDAAETLAEAERSRPKSDGNTERLDRLNRLVAIFDDRKGRWTPLVHRLVLIGYVLLFSSAVIRLLPA